MTEKPQPNLHATGLLVGDRGIVITGASGSGKSTLAHALLQAAHNRGVFARMVADDQLLLAAASGRLVASAPATIAGAAEVHGSGVHRLPHEPRMVVHLLVRLVEAKDAARFQPGSRESLHGIETPVLRLQQRNTTQALQAVLARLGIGPISPQAAEASGMQTD